MAATTCRSKRATADLTAKFQILSKNYLSVRAHISRSIGNRESPFTMRKSAQITPSSGVGNGRAKQ